MIPNPLPLESLRVFEACARHGSFTRAAAELSVTTAAVSQRIRELEKRLGVELFRRHGPRLALTERGALLGKGVRESLAALAEAVSECIDACAPLRVTVTPTFANRWLIERLADYERSGSPPIVLDVSTEVRRSEQFDVAIRSGEGPWRGLAGFPFLRIDATPMLSPTLSARLADGPASLSCVPHIADDRWPDWYRLVGVPEPEAAFTSARYPSQDACAIAAIQGAGVALLSPALFEKELGSGLLVAPFQEHCLEGPESYWVLWHAERPQPAFAAWLKSWMKQSD